MTRVLMIPLVVLCALPAAADDKLEAKLQELEARIAKLRTEAKQEAAARAKLDARLAALDEEIAVRKQADPTALGATRIADLQDERDKIEADKRALRSKLAKGEREVEAKVESAEESRRPVDVEGLIARVKRGDAQARAELGKLRARVDAALQSRAAAQQGSQVIALGGGAGIRVINRVIVGGRLVPTPPRAAPEPAPASKPVPAEEQAKREEQDLTDQQKRAAELESRIVEMTRKLMDLERRVAELKQKVAKPDAG